MSHFVRCPSPGQNPLCLPYPANYKTITSDRLFKPSPFFVPSHTKKTQRDCRLSPGERGPTNQLSARKLQCPRLVLFEMGKCFFDLVIGNEHNMCPFQFLSFSNTSRFVGETSLLDVFF